MLSTLKVIMIDTKNALNELSVLMDKQYDLLLEKDKDIIKMSELEQEILKVTKVIDNLELKRRSLIGNREMKDVVKELNNAELDVLLKDIGVIIAMLQIQKDNNMKLLKQLSYFTNKLINAIKPVDNYSTYGSDGTYGLGKY